MQNSNSRLFADSEQGLRLPPMHGYLSFWSLIWTLPLTTVAGFSLSSDIAWASPRDAFGIDPQTMARAGAVTATAPPAAAAAANPALLIKTHGLEAEFGVVVSVPNVKAAASDASSHETLDTYTGLNLGLAISLPLGPIHDRLFVGIQTHLPTEALYTLDNTRQGDVVILHLGNQQRRFNLDAAVAVRIWEQISIGAGFYLVPDVAGDVAIDFSGDVQNSRSHVEVHAKFAPTAGIYAEPIEGLRLGIAYRGASKLSLNVPARVYVSDAIGAIYTRLSGYAYAEPHIVSFGASYDFSHLTENPRLRFAAHLEFDYRHYADPIATSAEVTLYSENGDILSQTTQDYADFDDAWRIHTAIDWMPMDEICVSVGYAFEKTPVPPQRNIFNVLDADRHQIAFGGTFWIPDAWLGGFGLGFSTAAKFDVYDTRHVEKYIFLAGTGNPGFPALSFSGMAFTWQGSILMRFE